MTSPAGTDDSLLRDALRALRRRARLEVVLGGLVDQSGEMRLSGLGTVTGALENLHVVPSAGLGGRVLALSRPAVVNDYLASDVISHDYDRPVAAEGLRSMFAFPVADGRTTRMVLYGASRGVVPFGDRALTSATRIVESVGREVAIRAEVDRRMAALASEMPPAASAPPDSTQWDVVRSAYADLRQLASQIDDPLVQDKLAAISDRLAGASVTEVAGSSSPALSPRELDVLACVSVGCTNAETARRLQILPETVKSYLSGAMRKLGVRNRNAAAAVARRRGLLP